ncbi:MAG: hypothetical protein H7287_00020 [Thermoleophilia bacterium]|nr:hypothetical protein [Thermoleophilia bacterium]
MQAQRASVGIKSRSGVGSGIISVMPEAPQTATDDADEDVATCPHCGEENDPIALQCDTCGEPLDDPTRGICNFCGVAAVERCAGCDALICWECSDGARTGATSVRAGVPWCPDCRAGAGIA